MLKFDDDFFKAEYRDGFYIRETMKRYWASEMEVLARIDALCRKHNIRYFVFYGTMLGAVRHKGFIPWDDDIDIAMRRIDYMRFIKYAKEEFEGELLFVNTYESIAWPTRISNGNHISTEPKFLEKYHGCPYVTGIDIFIIDNICNNPDELNVIRQLWQLGVTASVGMKELQKGENVEAEEVYECLELFEQYTGQSINRNIDVQPQIGMIMDRLFASSYEEDSDCVAVMAYFFKHKSSPKFKKEMFEDSIYIPFENMEVPVPKDYDGVLSVIYNDYMSPRRGGATHSYPAFKDQIGYLVKRYNELNVQVPKEFDWEEDPQ